MHVEDVIRSAEAADHYTVKEDDTLVGIAKQFYKNGDESHYMAIFNANRHILKKPSEIYPNQILIIPKL